MSIDSQTIYVFSSMSLWGVAALVALAARRYSPELRRSGLVWAAATAAQGIGMAAIALRGIVPDAVSVLAAHGFGIGGLAGFLHALQRFTGTRSRPLLVYASVPLAIASACWFLFVVPSYAWRVAVFSALGALLLAVAAVTLWRARSAEAQVTSRVAAVGFSLGTALLLLRAVLSLAVDSSAPPLAIFRSSATEKGIVLALSLEFLLLAFTFLMLCNDRLNAELLQRALVDPLTGRYNRRGIREFALREVSRSRRGDLALSMALVDLDHLKTLNDTAGHAFGDAALCHVADCVARALRGEDEFGRWGGDELLVVLPNTDAEGALRACARIREFVADTAVHLDGTGRRCTVSIGIASRRGGTVDLEPMLLEADENLYAAKTGGRDRIQAGPPLERTSEFG